MGMVFRAGDDARLVVRGQPHRLRFVELRVLKCRDAKQSVPEARVQTLLGDVQLVAEDHLHRLRQCSDNGRCLVVTRGRRRPRLVVPVFLWRQPHAEDSAAPFRLLRDLLDLGAAHPAQAREERPLVGPWHECVIEEHAVALLSSALLQRQGNQVAKSALRHRVLVGKQAVVQIESNIRPALHRLRQQMRSEPSSQPGRDCTVEEDPDVSSATGARAFERGSYARAATCRKEGLGIFAPAGLVEVDRQEAAGLVLEQRVDPCDERLPVASHPRQMPPNDFIGHRKKAPMRASRTLDVRLITDSPHPFMGARGQVAGLPGLPALETAGIHVLTPPEEGTKECDLGVRRR